MKVKIALVAMFFTVLTFGAYAGLANAHTIRTGDNISFNTNQKVEDTLFVSGRNIDVSSEVYGDVFCAGQTVTISGVVHGDVICTGQTITINGTVDGDVRAAGQSVTLTANVEGNVTIASQTFSLASNAKIDGDLSLGASDATINGTIGRDLAYGGVNIIVGNKIGRNIKATTETFKLDGGARVQGNIDLTSRNDVNRVSGAVVAGKITRTDPPQQAKQKNVEAFGTSLAWIIYWFIAMLIIALTLVLLYPSVLQRSTERTLSKPWKAPLVGLVATIVVPIGLIMLAITFVGLPLAFILALLWLIILMLSSPFFAYFIGRLILKDSRKPIIIMLLGASILLLLYVIPILGGILFLAALWTGTGMILLELFNRTPKPAYSLPSRQTAAHPPIQQKVKKRNIQ